MALGLAGDVACLVDGVGGPRRQDTVRAWDNEISETLTRLRAYTQTDIKLWQVFGWVGGWAGRQELTSRGLQAALDRGGQNTPVG